MSGGGMEWIVNRNRIPELSLALPELVNAALRTIAIDIVATATELAAKDTTAMSRSVYAITDQGSGYSAAVSQAASANPDAEMEPEADAPVQPGIVVAAAASYAGYIEYGHHTRGGSFVPGRPFMQPAVDQAVPKITEAIAQEIVTKAVV